MEVLGKHAVLDVGSQGTAEAATLPVPGQGGGPSRLDDQS